MLYFQNLLDILSLISSLLHVSFESIEMQDKKLSLNASNIQFVMRMSLSDLHERNHEFFADLSVSR
jgi:hypothetical protein